jgi:hypothetical protein
VVVYEACGELGAIVATSVSRWQMRIRFGVSLSDRETSLSPRDTLYLMVLTVANQYAAIRCDYRAMRTRQP